MAELLSQDLRELVLFWFTLLRLITLTEEGILWL